MIIFRILIIVLILLVVLFLFWRIMYSEREFLGINSVIITNGISESILNYFNQRELNKLRSEDSPTNQFRFIKIIKISGKLAIMIPLDNGEANLEKAEKFANGKIVQHFLKTRYPNKYFNSPKIYQKNYFSKKYLIILEK